MANPGADMFRVNLSRPNSSVSWGFRLQGGADFSTPLSIQLVNVPQYSSCAIIFFHNLVSRLVLILSLSCYRCTTFTWYKTGLIISCKWEQFKQTYTKDYMSISCLISLHLLRNLFLTLLYVPTVFIHLTVSTKQLF